MSAVLTTSDFEAVIANGQGRIQQGHTHQGHALGVAAPLAVQSIVHTDKMLAHLHQMGEQMRRKIEDELGDHPFFREVRGRGLLFSLEYDWENKHTFGLSLEKTMLEKHNILIDSAWHRVSFKPPFVLTQRQAEDALDAFVETFRETATAWPG